MELTDDLLYKMAQGIKDEEDLMALGVNCLQMPSESVKYYTVPHSNESDAAFSLLQKWRKDQRNNVEAHAKLCQALEDTNMEFYLSSVIKHPGEN